MTTFPARSAQLFTATEWHRPTDFAADSHPDAIFVLDDHAWTTYLRAQMQDAGLHDLAGRTHP